VSRSVSAPQAPHAPRRGVITGVFWYRLHAGGVRLVPDRVVSLVVSPLVFLFSRALRQIAADVGKNLEAVLGPGGARQRRRRGRRTLREFAWCLTERYERLCTDRTFHVRLENETAWRAAGQGRGVVLLSAHLGLADFGSLLPVTEAGRRVHVVREEEMDPRAQRWFEGLLAQRLGALSYETHFQGADPGLGVLLLQALGRGDVVALQGDRPRAGGRALPVTLFGRAYGLPEGPPALARAAGVPLLPAYTLREGRRRYCVLFGQPIEVPRGPDRRADLAAAAAAIAASVEEAIRRAPHQWFCFAPLWE